jgi:hypothetical protein
MNTDLQNWGRIIVGHSSNDHPSTVVRVGESYGRRKYEQVEKLLLACSISSFASFGKSTKVQLGLVLVPETSSKDL